MSLGYSITAELSADFSQENMCNILEKGEKLGLLYYEYIVGELNIYSDPLTVANALRSIYKAQKEAEMYCITVEIEQTYFNLNFIDDNGRLIVMVPGLNHLWSRQYKNKKVDIDIERYIKFFLELIHDYQIIHLSVEYD